MKLLLRKLICLNLALIMFLGMLPTALAAEETASAVGLRSEGEEQTHDADGEIAEEDLPEPAPTGEKEEKSEEIYGAEKDEYTQTDPTSGVRYHGNGSDTFGGAAETVWVERPKDGFADLGDQGFQRAYCTFLGWSTSPSGYPEEKIEVPEGELVELYAVWGYNAVATYGDFRWTAGPVQLGEESGATQTDAAGTGWYYDSRVFLNESYPGGAIRTTNDLYLYADGDVCVDSIACGGTCFIEFADGASLTVRGEDEAYGIAAQEVRVGRFGTLTVSGGDAAVSGAVQTTANLTECSKNQGNIKNGAENIVRTGADEASSRTTGRYKGEKWLRVEGKSITVTYINGSSRDTQTQKITRAGVRIDRTPEPQDGRVFMGWALTAKGSGRFYYEDDVYPATDNVTFYARWAKTGEQMVYLFAGSGTVNGFGGITMQPDKNGLYRLPEAKGSTLFLGWMPVSSGGEFPGWNRRFIPEFDRSRELIEDNALLWPGESYALESGTALVAVWNNEKTRSGVYHVFKGNGGRTREDSPVALVQVSATATDLLTYFGMEKEGYFLAGWRSNSGGKSYAIGDDITGGAQSFTAQWLPKSAAAAMLYGGEGGMKAKQKYLQTTDLDASSAHGFRRAGYAFDGWYAYGETVPADVLEPGKAYLAHWKAYSVEYHDDGQTWYGSGTVENHEITLREDDTIFNGWNTQPDGSGEWFTPGTLLTSDLTLYAQYIDSRRDVLLFVSEGWFAGQNFRPLEALDEDDTFEIPKTLDGQSVLTWCQYYVSYEHGNRYIRTTFRKPGKQTVQSGTVVRAILPGGKYLADDELLLCGNGGVRNDDQEYQLLTVSLTASDLTLSDYVFSKTGVTQNGWYTQPDGRGQSFELDEPALTARLSNVHMLYAQWEKRVIRLTANGRTCHISENSHCSDSGWTCSLRDGVIKLRLRDYQGGAISITGGEGFKLEIQAMGENTITAEQTAAIEAVGVESVVFTGLSPSVYVSGMPAEAGTLHVTGVPALKTDTTFTLEQGGLRLENPDGGECVECKELVVNENLCEIKKTPGKDGATAKLETFEKTYKLTLHGNGGKTADGTETVTQAFHYGEIFAGSTLFTQAYHVFTGWKDASGTEMYGQIIVRSDMELYANWRPTKYPVTALFYDHITDTDMEIAVKDGSCVVPPLPDDPNGQTLYWYYEDDDGVEHPCLPGDTVQLNASRQFRAFTMPGETKGIVFHPNGGTLSGHKRPSTNFDCLTTQSWTGSNGAQLFSWNTRPDGTGTSYAASGASVPEAEKQWVVLFAQWIDRDEDVYVNLSNSMVDEDTHNMRLRAGDTFTFPEPKYPEDLDVTFVGWRNSHISSGDNRIYQPGESYLVREGDLLWFSAAWTVNDTYMIDGKSYPYPKGTEDFYDFGSGWELAIYWTGEAYLELSAYHGGAIDFPANLTIITRKDSAVTGAAGQSAIHSGRGLSLNTHCSWQHVKLDLTGGTGAAAASGEEVYLESHVTMTGGVRAQKVAVASQIWGGADRASARQLKNGQAAIGLAYAETRASSRKMTVYGNGGTTPSGETEKTLLLDDCLIYPLKKTTGFTYPGHMLLGYYDAVGLLQSEGLRPHYNTIDLVWQKADYANWIAFKDYDGQYTFFDNAQPVTAPAADASWSSEFICWQTNPYVTGEPVHQYFPGETVDETDETLLTGLYTFSSSPNLILYSNGKTYSDGTRVKKGSRYASATAADGTQPLSWNTEPDGSGESYPVGWHIPMTDTLANQSLRLYAQWKRGSKPSEEQPSHSSAVSSVTTAPTVSVPTVSAPADVTEEAWFHEDVQYVLDKGLMKGVAENRFAPNDTLTRAMIVTILHRMVKTPEASENTFSDVKTDTYYASAVAWAAQNGIVTGIKSGVFAPDANLTRGQLAAILYRFAVKLGYTAEVPADAPFADVPRGSYYEAAVAWAAQNGIVTGMKADVFAPDAPVTRAQAAAILHRFCDAYRLF